MIFSLSKLTLTWFSISLEEGNQTYIAAVLKFPLTLENVMVTDKGPYLLHILTFEFSIRAGTTMTLLQSCLCVLHLSRSDYYPKLMLCSKV